MSMNEMERKIKELRELRRMAEELAGKLRPCKIPSRPK